MLTLQREPTTWVLIELLKIELSYAGIGNQILNKNFPPCFIYWIWDTHILCQHLIHRFWWILNFPLFSQEDRFLISSYGTFHKLDWSFNSLKCLFTRTYQPRGGTSIKINVLFDNIFSNYFPLIKCNKSMAWGFSWVKLNLSCI